MRQIVVVLLASALANVATAGPRAGELDPTFGQGGVVAHGFELVENGIDDGGALVRDAEGRLYLAGSVQTGEQTRCLGVARFLPDGGLDASYANGGNACLPSDPLPAIGPVHAATDALLMADGSLVIGGTVGETLHLQAFVCRLRPGGTFDPAFASGTTPGCRVFDLEQRVESKLQIPGVLVADNGGELVVAINPFSQTVHDPRPLFARLDENGNIVPFGSQDVVAPFDEIDPIRMSVSDLAISPEGGYVVAGSGYNPNGVDALVGLLDPISGALDTQFNSGGYHMLALPEYTLGDAVSIAADGTVTVAGHVDDGAALVYRLNPDGTMDASFHDGEPQVYNFLTLSDYAMRTVDLQVADDGKIVLAGSMEMNGDLGHMWALRLQSDGTPDGRFGSTVPGQEGYAFFYEPLPGDTLRGLVLQGERVVLGGTVHVGDGGTNAEFALFRLADGSLLRDGFEGTE